jgi:hypothetical protein
MSKEQQGLAIVRGVLTDEGVECQAMRGDGNALYTLVGDLKGCKTGDKVKVAGHIAAMSYCMQGTTIGVTDIVKEGQTLDFSKSFLTGSTPVAFSPEVPYPEGPMSPGWPGIPRHFPLPWPRPRPWPQGPWPEGPDPYGPDIARSGVEKTPSRFSFAANRPEQLTDPIIPWPWATWQTTPWPFALTNPEAVASVEMVYLSLLKSNPPQLVVSAIGKVGSTGYTDPSLSPVVYIVEPADGVHELHFLARPPHDPSLQVLMPIAAQYVFTGMEVWKIKGVKVHAASNSITQMLDAQVTIPKALSAEEYKTWMGKKLIPSGSNNPGGDVILEDDIKDNGIDYLIVPPGKAVTLDYRPFRLRIMVDKKNIISSLAWG